MIINNCNPNKLHDEFIANNIFPEPVLILGDSSANFIFPSDTDISLVKSIIKNHDPKNIVKSYSLEERLEISEQTILFLMDMIIQGGM